MGIGIKGDLKEEIFNVVNENIKALERLFPSAVKDGQVDFQALKEELGEFEEVGPEKYTLTWSGKQNAKKIAQQDIVGKTLKYIPEDSKNPETTENLYIEGDNLEVLKLLRQNYYGAIKMIYIDPPYNTGNDFVYKDNFDMSKEESDKQEGNISELGERYTINSRSSNKYHANWLNMMYARLKIAKDLLKDDGVIFISIDDSEASNLKKICDEIFGEQNYETTFYIKVRHENRILREDIRYQLVMEQVLCYRKTNVYTPNRIPKEDNLDNEYMYDIKIVDKYSEKVNINGYNVEIYKKGQYEIVNKDIGKGIFKKYQIRGSLISQKGSASEYYEKNLRTRRVSDGEGTLYKVINMGIKGDGLGYRYIMQPDNINSKNGFYFQGRPLNIKSNIGLPHANFYDFVKEANNVGYEGDIEFKNGKKPLKFLEKLFELSNVINDKEAVILDFFSGSASTAHEIINLNINDNGNRKFIMIQIPEKISSTSAYNSEGFMNVCEIGKERIRRAGEKIKEENKDKEGIDNLDIGFKVFRVGDTNIRWNYESDTLKILTSEVTSLSNEEQTTFNFIAATSQISLDEVVSPKDRLDFMPGAKDIDIVYEILLRHRDIPLSAKIELLEDIGKRTYIFADSYLVCLETEITNELIEKLAAINPLPIKFILRDSAFGDDIALKDEAYRRLRALIERNSGESKKSYTVEFI